MAKFAYVENDQIIEVRDYLPLNTTISSGFYMLEGNEPELNKQGWYTVQKRYQTYDERTQILMGYSHVLESNVVYEELILEDRKPVDPPQYPAEIKPSAAELLAAARIEFFKQLRIQRDQFLAASDWTQLADVQFMHSEEWRTAWATYRQGLRDLPQALVNTDNYDVGVIEWPALPSEL